ncbi:MAG: PAS domain S-box protein [Bryobacteraceae bacterium]
MVLGKVGPSALFSRLAPYGIAVLAICLAVFLKLGLREITGSEVSFIMVLFAPAVIVALYFGFWPSAFATVLSAAISAYYLPPQGTFAIGLSGWLRVITFTVEGLAIAYLSAARVAAQKGEQQQNTVLRTVIEQMPVGIVVAEAPSGKLLLSNRRVEEILHIPLSRHSGAEPKGENHIFHLDAGQYSAENNPMARAIRSGEVVESEEFHYHHDDGARSILSVSAAPILDQSGQITGGVMACFDVTTRKRMEEELLQSRQQIERQLLELESVYQNTPVGLCFVDPELRYVRVNAQLAAMHGLPVTEHAGRTLAETTPELAPELERAYRSVLDSGLPAIDLEIRGMTPASPNETRTWLISHYPVKDKVLLGVCTVVQDITERKQMERALRASEEKHRLISEALPQLIWTMDPEGRQESVNGRLYEYTGIRTDENFLDKLPALIHPADLPASEALWRKARTADESYYETELRIKRSMDGAYRWHLSQVRPIRTTEGQVLKWVGAAIDIDDRKKAEEKLRQQAEVLDLAYDAILILDLDGTIEFWNEGAARLYGWPKQEAMGQSARSLLRTEFPEPGNTIEHQLVTQGRWEGEVIHTTRSGRRVVASSRWALRKDLRGVPIGRLEINRDITESKQAESAIALMAGIVEFSEDSILSKDLNGIILTCNAGAERVYGYAGQEIIGRSIDLLLPPDRIKEQKEVLEGLQTGKRLEHFETVRIRKDGKQIHVSITISPVRNKAGEVIGASDVARDITEQKQLEEQLRQTQKLESLGVLAGGVAHDFNNLLTGIMGNASLLFNDMNPGSENAEFADAIVRASERAANLTGQLLAYAGKGRFMMKPVDCSHLVREISELISASIPKKVKVQLQFHDQLPAVLADVSQLEQLIMNLIINGAEAIGDHAGTVTVRTGVQRVDKLYLRNSPGILDELEEGEYVVLEVQDTGCGMDAQIKSKIFDPFFTTKFTGRGLGLAAVRGIIRGHKGGLKVTSAPGQGTSFKVWLPVAGEGITLPKAQLKAFRADVRCKGTILVVDDEELVQKFAKATLEKSGYTVVGAGDGQKAIDIVTAMGPQLAAVLLDMTMPILGGAEVLPRLKRLAPGVPVIGSSGHSEITARADFGNEGLAGFVQKPYTSTTLMEAVTEALENYSRSASSSNPERFRSG